MIRGILRLLVIGVLLFVFVLPVRHFIKKIVLNHQLESEEKKTIGSIDMNNPRVKEIQGILQDLRYYAGLVDGKMDRKTRMAIRSFQGEKGLAATGVVDPKTLSEFNKQEVAIQKIEKQKAVAQLPKEPKQLVKIDNKQAAENTPKNKIEVQDKIMNFRIESVERVRAIQSALRKSGFYKGNIDGKVGLETEKAIKDFQVSKKLKVDGVVGSKTWDELKKLY